MQVFHVKFMQNIYSLYKQKILVLFHIRTQPQSSQQIQTPLIPIEYMSHTATATTPKLQSRHYVT